MLQISALIIFLSFPIWIVILTNLLETVYLWQVKEFRLDRVMSHYKYEGSLSLNDEFSIIVRITFVTVMLMYAMSPLSLVLGISALLAIVYYDVNALRDFGRFLHKKMHRPSLRSPRNLLIIILTLAVTALPYFYLYYVLLESNSIAIFERIVVDNPPLLQNEYFLSMPLATQSEGLTIISLPLFLALFSLCVGVIIDLLIPLIVPIMVLTTSPLATIRRGMIIRSAKLKIKRFPDIKVVAVTGSYGKTTTKEITDQIVSQKFKTIKTQKHNNTEVGIAKTILEQINQNVRVFVAEMGAYKLGETRECAKIAPPDIAIITGIDEQHISLYGSFKAILDSTLEVVDELKPNGVVILNGDNDYCLRLADKISHPKRIYFTEKFPGAGVNNFKSSSPIDSNLYISELNETPKGLEFTVKFKGDSEKLKTNIKGKHNAGNIACAILSATELGISLKETAKIINSTAFNMPYLSIKEGVNGAKFIDDGYNINPSGYYAGLKFLSEQKVKGKKWVLTQGFIELGNERDTTYKKVAKETILNSDGIISNDLDLCAEISRQSNDFFVSYTESVFNLALIVKRDVKKEDVVLIEGPLPKQVLDKI